MCVVIWIFLLFQGQDVNILSWKRNHECANDVWKALNNPVKYPHCKSSNFKSWEEETL